MFHTVGSCNASSHHLPHCPTRSNHDANFNSATLFVPSFPSSPFLPGITMCCHHELLLPPLLETRGWSRRMGEEKWSKERWIHRRRYVFKRRGELLPLPVFIVHRLSVEDFLLCRKEIILLLPRILLSQPIGFFNYRSRARYESSNFRGGSIHLRSLKGKKASIERERSKTGETFPPTGSSSKSTRMEYWKLYSRRRDRANKRGAAVWPRFPIQ